MAGGPIYKGGIPYFKPGIRFQKNAGVFSGTGAPTNGTSGTGVGKFGKGSIYIDYTNGKQYFNTGTQSSPTWVGIPVAAQTAVLQDTPANPTGTTSTTLVMMGLAESFTPVFSTRMEISICGNIAQSTTADGAGVQLSYGTGTAPANAAAVTGTQVGSLTTMTFLTGVLLVPFSLTAIVTGLTAGTAYWVDLALKAVTGGTASVTNLSVSVCEL